MKFVSDTNILSVVWHIQTHIHIIPRNARDCLWASEVTVISLSHTCSTCKPRNKWRYTVLYKLQSLQRQPLKCSKEASNLVECIREKLSSLENYKADTDQGLTSLIGNLREHWSLVIAFAWTTVWCGHIATNSLFSPLS